MRWVTKPTLYSCAFTVVVTHIAVNESTELKANFCHNFMTGVDFVLR